MNWLEHDYLVPIFLGSCKVSTDTAKALRKAKRARVHFFAEKFDIMKNIKFLCHKVTPFHEHLLLFSLMDFAEELEEYNYPVIIYGEVMKDFIESNREALESRFLVVSCDYANKCIMGEQNGI